MSKQNLLILLLAFPILNGWAQSSIPQDSIKEVFSSKYYLWMQIRDRIWEADECFLKEVPEGAYYHSLRLKSVFIDGIVGLSLFHIEKNGDDIFHNGHVVSSFCSDIKESPMETENFLIGVNESGELRYLSGDLILNEARYFLENSRDYAKLAEVRLFYLEPENIKPYNKKHGGEVYSAYSGTLHKNVLIEFNSSNPDIFTIWEKGRSQEPLIATGMNSNRSHRH